MSLHMQQDMNVKIRDGVLLRTRKRQFSMYKKFEFFVVGAFNILPPIEAYGYIM